MRSDGLWRLAIGWKEGCATTLRWWSFVISFRDQLDSSATLGRSRLSCDDAQFVPERDTGVLHCFLLPRDESFPAWRWPRSDVVALQKVMRRCCDLSGNGLSLHCFIILGTNVQQDKSCWKNGSVLDDLFDELFVVSCYDCLWVGCLWLVLLIGFVMFLFFCGEFLFINLGGQFFNKTSLVEQLEFFFDWGMWLVFLIACGLGVFG